MSISQEPDSDRSSLFLYLTLYDLLYFREKKVIPFKQTSYRSLSDDTNPGASTG